MNPFPTAAEQAADNRKYAAERYVVYLRDRFAAVLKPKHLDMWMVQIAVSTNSDVRVTAMVGQEPVTLDRYGVVYDDDLDDARNISMTSYFLGISLAEAKMLLTDAAVI